jgi:hypothetical protein
MPHLADLAREDSTLFIIVNLVTPRSSANLKGPNRSVVSPDYDTPKRPPFGEAKSNSLISEAILT